MEDKIRVYVCTMKGISTLDFVDKESMAHACAVADGGSDRVFSGFRNLPVGSWDGCLSEDQARIVDMVREFCQENQLEYEIVDVANSRFTNKMKQVFKGVRAPAVTFRGKKIEGVPTKEDLRNLIGK